MTHNKFRSESLNIIAIIFHLVWINNLAMNQIRESHQNNKQKQSSSSDKTMQSYWDTVCYHCPTSIPKPVP